MYVIFYLPLSSLPDVQDTSVCCIVEMNYQHISPNN